MADLWFCHDKTKVDSLFEDLSWLLLLDFLAIMLKTLKKIFKYKFQKFKHYKCIKKYVSSMEYVSSMNKHG